MKTKNFRSYSIAGVMVFTLGFASAVFAAGTQPRELLRDAYIDLALANHDYQGHKVKAMDELSEAGKQIGMVMKGSERGHKPQRESDAQLREARRLLEDARTKLEERDRAVVATHLSEAVRQINLALNPPPR